MLRMNPLIGTCVYPPLPSPAELALMSARVPADLPDLASASSDRGSITTGAHQPWTADAPVSRPLARFRGRP